MPKLLKSVFRNIFKMKLLRLIIFVIFSSFIECTKFNIDPPDPCPNGNGNLGFCTSCAEGYLLVYGVCVITLGAEDRNGNGLIEIISAEQLYNIRYNTVAEVTWKTSYDDVGTSIGCPNGVCRGYELVTSIDFATTKWGTSTAYTGADRVTVGWEPIGSCGTNELCTDAGDQPFVAIFEGNGFRILNLYINRPTASNETGLFGSISNSASMNQVLLFNFVIHGGRYTGGLVGHLASGSITNSSVTGALMGGAVIGGLVGRQSGSSNIIDSYAAVSVTSSNAGSIGGLVGAQRAPAMIINSHARGSVSGGNISVGGLVGQQGPSGRIANSSAMGSVEGGSFIGGLVGFQEEEASIVNSFATGPINSINVQAGGLVGRQLERARIVNSYATGSVTGSGMIGGLVGFQGSDSSIVNSYATGSINSTDVDTGGLVGQQLERASIMNSYATGAVVSTADDVGGLVGQQEQWASVANSYSSGSVSGRQNVGGLVGRQEADVIIVNSYASGSVMATLPRVGGLVGRMGGGSIINSYATGNVSGGTQAGGLVGLEVANSRIISSYATGSVSGSTKVGGLVGDSFGRISNTYASGAVSGTADVGGLVGDHSDISLIANSYWDTTATGLATSAGLAIEFGLTTIRMQATTGIYPSLLGSCFQLNVNQYPKIYTLRGDVCTTELLFGPNATR